MIRIDCLKDQFGPVMTALGGVAVNVNEVITTIHPGIRDESRQTGISGVYTVVATHLRCKAVSNIITVSVGEIVQCKS
ncbi:MAG: hypothetical protein GY751_26780 [Bacteroidetes bacterium]|nr:hypothetical protein [Bacteroidota bacterium]